MNCIWEQCPQGYTHSERQRQRQPQIGSHWNTLWRLEMRKGGEFPSITVYSNGTKSAVDLAVRCGYTLKWASFQVHLKFRRRVFSHCILKERNCPKNKFPVWPATEVFQPPASRLFFSSFHREARHTGTSTWAGNTIIIIILYHIISYHITSYHIMAYEFVQCVSLFCTRSTRSSLQSTHIQKYNYFDETFIVIT